MPFNYAIFVKGLMEKEEAKRGSYASIQISLDDLSKGTLIPQKNPFRKLYPEHLDFLNQPHNLVQHRMQYVPLTHQSFGDHMSTFVVLRTDPTFKGAPSSYFGAPIAELARQSVDVLDDSGIPRLLPMILNPLSYQQDEGLKGIYEPLFASLYANGLGDRLAYANRMEDYLSMRTQERTWEDFRKAEIAPFTDAGVGGITLPPIGDLTGQALDVYIGERVAWLKLLGLEELASDLQYLAIEKIRKGNLSTKEQKESINLARMVAFLLGHLYITPIFYSHNTSAVWHVPFDNDTLGEVFRGYVHAVFENQMLDAKASVERMSFLMACLGYLLVSASLAPLPLSFEWLLPKTRAALELMRTVAPGISNLIRSPGGFNHLGYQHTLALAQRNPDDVQATIRNLYRGVRQIHAYYENELRALPDALRVVVAKGAEAVSLWRPSDTSVFKVASKVLRTRRFKSIDDAKARALVRLVDKVEEFLHRCAPKESDIKNPILKGVYRVQVRDFRKVPVERRDLLIDS